MAERSGRLDKFSSIFNSRESIGKHEITEISGSLGPVIVFLFVAAFDVQIRVLDRDMLGNLRKYSLLETLWR